MVKIKYWINIMGSVFEDWITDGKREKEAADERDTSIHVSTGPQLILLSAMAEKRDRYVANIFVTVWRDTQDCQDLVKFDKYSIATEQAHFTLNLRCHWSLIIRVTNVYHRSYHRDNGVVSYVIPRQCPLMCRFLAARWALSIGGHKYTSASVCPAPGSLRMTSLPASFDPDKDNKTFFESEDIMTTYLSYYKVYVLLPGTWSGPGRPALWSPDRSSVLRSAPLRRPTMRVGKTQKKKRQRGKYWAGMYCK